MQRTKENILYRYRRYTVIFALVFSVIGLVLDIIQQLGITENWLTGFVTDSGNSGFGSNINLVILNLITIVIFLFLLFFLVRKSGEIMIITIIFVLTLCANNYIAYFWYFANTSIIASYILRDLLLFYALIFVSATCANTFFTILITALTLIFYLLFSILSHDYFLIENIPLAILLTGAFAFVFRLIVIILEKSIQKQEEEAHRIKELSQFKEKMSQMLLHDIKVPLNSILMLSHSPLSASNLEKIHYQASKVSRMLGNIIDVESRKNVKIRLNPTTFLLSAWIDEAIEQVHYHALEKNISIRKNIQEGKIGLRGDKDLLDRCLINILENAIKYSPENTAVHILGKAGKNEVNITISDEGPGIKPGDEQKIFELFYTAADNIQKERSSGIGLTFCKMVAEAHEGKIMAGSNPSGGAIFTMSMPLVIQDNNIIADKSQNPFESFSEDTLRLLRPLAGELWKTTYYQSSEIIKILNKVPVGDNKKIREEVEKIKELALSCNKDLYENMLKSIS